MAIRVYFAAPLFDDMELRRNLEECHKLEDAGFEVFLPQRDAGEAAEGASRSELFRNDITHVSTCDIVIAYLDGRVPDEGTVFELGAGYAYGKECAIVLTDRRSFMVGHLNVMLEHSAKIFKNTEEAIEWMTS